MFIGDVMQIEIKNNQFIEIKDLIKVLDIEALIRSYIFDNFSLNGEYEFKVKYCSLSKQLDDVEQLETRIPFEIVMPEVQSIDKIEMINFEYYAVERRGIEIELTLNIEYQTQEDIISDIDESIDDILEEQVGTVEEKKDEIFPRLEKRTRYKV